MTEGFIYSITLKGQDRPVYIGQTRQAPERRWRQHMRDATPISKALQFFGTMDDFHFAVIDSAPECELNAREEFWIDQYGTLHPNGLNMTKGGFASKRSAASKLRMSISAKRRAADPEWRKKQAQLWEDPKYRENMIAKFKARRPGFNGKHSAETKAKMSDAHRRPGQGERYRLGALKSAAIKRAKKAGVLG
jgi:group I intron endonuclease